MCQQAYLCVVAAVFLIAAVVGTMVASATLFLDDTQPVVAQLCLHIGLTLVAVFLVASASVFGVCVWRTCDDSREDNYKKREKSIK